MSNPAEKSPLSTLRHDLRTPINHIIGYSELLEEDLQDRGIRDLADLEKIQTAARKLLDLIATGLADENFRGELAEPSDAPASLSNESAQYSATSASVPVEDSAENQAIVPGKILVVDDNEENRQVLVKRLIRQGHTIAQADDGRAALDILEKEPFDLVLLDLIMPGMDGYTALLELKASEKLRHIPVIMISALDEIESVVRCIEAGAEDYLPKPFNSTILRARIGASLEKKSFRDQEQAYMHRIEETQQRLAEELQEAGRYVASILPPPTDSPFKITWSYDPSTELGGDSFGYHWIDDEHFAIYLLDVCGHGVGAALLSVAAINVIRTGALPDTDLCDPSQVLASLNEAFQMERHNNMYFTIWYGVYNKNTRVLRHASGGHPPALLLSRGENGADVLDEVRAPGMIIGVMPGVKYDSQEIAIAPGSRLFVYCDGAYEIKRPDNSMIEFDEDFVPFVLKNGRSEKLPGELLDWIRTIHVEPVLDDDYSFVAIDLA